MGETVCSAEFSECGWIEQIAGGPVNQAKRKHSQKIREREEEVRRDDENG